jgi:uncharacterized OB-fold protein
MDVQRDPPYEGPIPSPGATERPFYEAALVFQRCPSCGHAQFYPRPVCTACGADPVFERASGRGVVHTFTVVRQMGQRPFRDRLPYVVAMVELPEGVRMMGNVTDCSPEDVQIGMAVEAYAVVFEDGLAVPFWRPISPDDRASGSR